MTSEKHEYPSGGISFAGMLTILFVGLKLTHYIDWPWLWVLSPLWLPILVFLGLVGLVWLLLVTFKIDLK